MSGVPESIGEIAARYAAAGLATFPVHAIDDGRCSCHNDRCTSPGKHPIGSLVPQGVLDATIDPVGVGQWWAVWPDANIGIATGDASGIVVVDVDLDGADTLDHLKARYGELDPTWMVETGSGGIHLYYRMPNADVRNSAGAIGPGIDVRGNGGYVVAPPSLHVSGGRYAWDEAWHPRRVRLGQAPEWLLKRMAPGSTPRSAAPLPRELKAGTRNTWLTSAAGTMRRRGFGQNAITLALKAENRERCRPPLDEREIERIAWSIGRYEAGERAHAAS